MSVTFHSSGIAADSFLIGTTPANPAKNAKEILAANPAAPTGFYWISWPGTVEGAPILVHCDMTGSLAGSSFGGWMSFDIGTVARHSRILAHNDSVNTRLPYYGNTLQKEPTIRLNGLRWDDASSNGTPWFTVPSTRDAQLFALKIRVPEGSRGLRIAGFDFFSVNGPDGYGFADNEDNPTVSPNKQEIVSAGSGGSVTFSSNYSSFGLYFGNSSGNGKRFFKGNSASPWTTEANNVIIRLPASRFDQSDDIGTDADRIIWYGCDGSTEHYNIYGFKFWIR